MTALTEITKSFKKLEKELKDKDKTIHQHEQMVGRLREDAVALTNRTNRLSEDVQLWTETAGANEELLNDYKNRERNSLEILQQMIMNHMEDHVLYMQVSKDGYGRILRAFRGLSKDRKEELKLFIEDKMDEIEAFAKVKEK